MNKRYLVGSQYFFKGFSDFVPKDLDELILEENPKDYKIKMQITGKGKCLFKWRKLKPQQFIEYTKLPMELGKFLVKEVCQEIGFTIEHLKQLKPIVDKLDEKHLYEKVIWESYIENNDFHLTNEQLSKAYECYKKYRQ